MHNSSIKILLSEDKIGSIFVPIVWIKYLYQTSKYGLCIDKMTLQLNL